MSVRPHAAMGSAMGMVCVMNSMGLNRGGDDVGCGGDGGEKLAHAVEVFIFSFAL